MDLRKIFVCSGFALLAGCLGSSAAPVSPNQALQEARSLRSELPAGSLNMKRVSAQPEIVFTSRQKGETCYYIVNDPATGGFVIVSGDDRLPSVIGYSFNGGFDEKRISSTMKWWLSEYENQISGFLQSVGNEEYTDSRPSRASFQERPEVKPLLASTWNQTEPYNDMCPMDANTGRRSVTGCVATAMAQVMRYHQWPVHPKGSANGFTFDGTTLDWGNMLDSYENGAYSGTQAQAVALLMRECGAGVNMTYTAYESGAYSFDVPVALAEYFDYDAGMRIHWRNLYTQSQWNSLVYEEISHNRPVYYSGRSSQGGHAFVVDGYKSNNYFHLNWGWGGYQDGYFLLNALNPSSGGTGSYAGGYNSDQSIIAGVQKNTGKGTRQITMISTGGFNYNGVSGNTVTFNIAGSEENNNLIYNPLAYSVSVTPGVKIVPKAQGGQVRYVAVGGGSQTYESHYGYRSFGLQMPSLSNGVYKVSPAIQLGDGTWQDVGVPVNTQQYVTMTVENGRTTYSNDGVEAGMSANVIASSIRCVTPVYSDSYHNFKITYVNTGVGDYIGNVNVLFMNQTGKGGRLTLSTEAYIPGMSSAEIEFSSPREMTEGRYAVSSYGDDLQFFGEDIYLEVGGNKGFTSSDKDGVVFRNISPTFATAGQPMGISILAENTSYRNATLDYDIKILADDGVTVVKTIDCGSQTFIGNQTMNLNFAPSDLGLVPGGYYLVGESGGTRLCLPQPLCVTGEPFVVDGVRYCVTSEARKEAMVVENEFSEYSGTVHILSEVNGYKVTAVKAGAFTFAEDLDAIQIDPELKTLYPGMFYNAGLRFLYMQPARPAELSALAFNPDRIGRILLSAGDINKYYRTDVWNKFNISKWNILMEEGITPEDLEIDPATSEPYAPYCINAHRPLVFRFKAPDGKSVLAEWQIGDDPAQTQTFWRHVEIPSLAGGEATLKLSLVDDTGVDGIDEDTLYDVYGIDGTVLLRSASRNRINTLPRGVYIINRKKFVVR